MHEGLLVEFDTPERLLAGLRKALSLAPGRVETFTPWPVEGVDELLGLPSARGKVARNTLIAGLLGAATAYLIQWYCNAYDYPLDVGGRPAHAAPAFVLITFETTVLFAGFGAFLSVFGYGHLPQPWHALFEVEAFRRAAIDRFFLTIEPDEKPLDMSTIRQAMLDAGALQIVAVRDER